MDLVDFLINVHPELPMDERLRLESAINKLEGVVSACFSPGHQHMLTITYNPETISSDTVLEHVCQRGIAADKVGL
jgi:hypothetical protein